MYGCGSDDCKACYPFTYRCPNCLAEYAQPVPNGDSLPKCDECDYDGTEAG